MGSSRRPSGDRARRGWLSTGDPRRTDDLVVDQQLGCSTWNMQLGSRGRPRCRTTIPQVFDLWPERRAQALPGRAGRRSPSSLEQGPRRWGGHRALFAGPCSLGLLRWAFVAGPCSLGLRGWGGHSASSLGLVRWAWALFAGAEGVQMLLVECPHPLCGWAQPTTSTSAMEMVHEPIEDFVSYPRGPRTSRRSEGCSVGSPWPAAAIEANGPKRVGGHADRLTVDKAGMARTGRPVPESKAPVSRGTPMRASRAGQEEGGLWPAGW